MTAPVDRHRAGRPGDPGVPYLAVHYLAEPGARHPDLPEVGPGVAAELAELHARCLAGRGSMTLDAGAMLLEVTARGRIRFVGGASSTPMLDADLVDAVVHAARAGYQLCLGRDPDDGSGTARYKCWLPRLHAGECERRGWWRWILLYGYRGPVTVVCTSCTPHRHVPAPADCPHR